MKKADLVFLLTFVADIKSVKHAIKDAFRIKKMVGDLKHSTPNGRHRTTKRRNGKKEREYKKSISTYNILCDLIVKIKSFEKLHGIDSRNLDTLREMGIELNFDALRNSLVRYNLDFKIRNEKIHLYVVEK